VKSEQLKLVSAGIGASAVVAMSALGLVFSDVGAAQPQPPPPPPGPVTTSEITTGETITETVVPEAPETTAATPPITTTPTSAEPG
jgi:hypothetical protein